MYGKMLNYVILKVLIIGVIGRTMEYEKYFFKTMLVLKSNYVIKELIKVKNTTENHIIKN